MPTVTGVKDVHEASTLHKEIRHVPLMLYRMKILWRIRKHIIIIIINVIYLHLHKMYEVKLLLPSTAYTINMLHS